MRKPCLRWVSRRVAKNRKGLTPEQALLPTLPPTLREVIRLIAKLGGLLGRKRDGELGVKTLGLGFLRIRNFVERIERMHAYRP